MHHSRSLWRLPAITSAATLVALTACSSSNDPAPQPPPPPPPAFLGAEARLDTPGASSAEASEPVLVRSGSRVYVAWTEDRDNSGREETYVNASSDGGRTWMANDVQVPGSEDSGIENDESNVSCDGANLYLVWATQDTNGTVWFSKSTDGGATFLANPIRLDGSGPSTSDSDDPQIACVGQFVYVLWKNSGNGADDIYLNRSTDGGTTWEGALLIDDNGAGASDSREHQIAAEGNDVWAVWSDDRDGTYDVYVARSTDNGATWSTNVRVDSDVPGSWWSSDPEFVVNGSEVVVTWLDGRPPSATATAGAPEGIGGEPPFDVYVRHSPDGGTTWSGPEVRLDDGEPDDDLENLRIVRQGDLVMIAWESNPAPASTANDGIHVNWSVDGGRSWQVRPTRVDEDAGGDTDAPAIGIDAGRMFVGWEDDRDGEDDIRLVRSDDSGATWSGSVRVDTDGAGEAKSSSPVIVCADGECWIAWKDRRSGNFDIYVNGGVIP